MRPPIRKTNDFVSEAIRQSMVRRRAAERRFRNYGRLCVLFAIGTLTWLLIAIFSTGLSAFSQHWLTVDLAIVADKSSDRNERRQLADALSNRFAVEANSEIELELLSLVSASAAAAQLRQIEDPAQRSFRLDVPVSARADQYLKGRLSQDLSAQQRGLSEQQFTWLEAWKEQGLVERRFNTALLTQTDSRDVERAGLASALFGSVMIVLIAGTLAIPVGIGAAVYLDEFAPRTGWGGYVTRAIEVNINNLAAVPAIVFGLLGLAIFVNVVGLARSIPLVGGLVMALRMFPTVVIASRSALQAVPESMTDSALSLGASPMQAIFNHKVPIAAPAMLTGSIIGMAQALGETAPLLMIGMVAFVTTVPMTPMDPATALPVQIFLWSGSAEAAWGERASAAIIVLLLILIVINGFAFILRQKLQRRHER